MQGFNLNSYQELKGKKMNKLLILLILLAGCDFYPANVENYNQKYRYVMSSENVGNFVDSYFPVKTGNTWQYKVYINPLIKYISEEDILWDKDSIFKFEIGEEKSLNENNWYYFKNSVNGYLINNYKLKDCYYIKHDSSISFLKFVHGISDIKGNVLLFDFNLKGNEFMDCRYRGEKDVNIPLGNFKTQVFENVDSNKGITDVYYFARNIGFVLHEYLDVKGNALYRYTLFDYKIN